MPSGIAKLWKPVVNVTDLDVGEQFWSAVSGLTPQGRHGGQFSVLDYDDDEQSSTDRWMLLQLVPAGQVNGGSGTHLDFRVEDVALAAQQIEAIGGTVLKPPAIYTGENTPNMEWAIMQDPFGNEFCIIRYPA
ncbi:MAG: VOC family protein [Nocardioidaceae bacterium]